MTTAQPVHLYSVSSATRTVSCTYAGRTPCSQFRRIRFNSHSQPHHKRYLQLWKNEEIQFGGL